MSVLASLLARMRNRRYFSLSVFVGLTIAFVAFIFHVFHSPCPHPVSDSDPWHLRLTELLSASFRQISSVGTTIFGNANPAYSHSLGEDWTNRVAEAETQFGKKFFQVRLSLLHDLPSTFSHVPTRRQRA
jgi:hypothetical protein